ncbi:MAG: hypothetical protein HOV81_38330 [Kofleriaceae bacterium]|nr:hypothetical protein [Kofleriaceae bacterium]
MRLLLVACLFAVACKSESSTSTPAATEKPTPTEVAKPERNRARPQLPNLPKSDDDRMRPRLPGREEPRDWTDPEVREEMRANREERRAKREAMLDTNHDGVISDEERVQRMEPMRTRLDTNGDGKLTPDELASSERRMGFDDPAALDENHDGDISLSELDKAVTTRRAEMRARWRGRGGGSANLPAGSDSE